jgi:uncharacterized membrane protein YhaH (DUF805 family)
MNHLECCNKTNPSLLADQHPTGEELEQRRREVAPWSFKGRINRATFWKTHVAMVGWTLIVAGIGVFIYALGTNGTITEVLAEILAAALAVLFVLFCNWITIATHVKRLHDLGISGYAALLGVIPIVNIVYLLVATVWLGVIRGEKRENQFGPEL